MTNKHIELVSIITPVFDAEHYLKETIESVLRQTYTEFEYILVDDCSSDNSIAIINSFDDPRIVLIKNNFNIGAAASRNKAICSAKGRYIAFIDSDDIWKEDKLERQIEVLLNSNAPLSYTGLDIMDDSGNYIKYQKVPEVMTYKKLLRNTAIATSSVVLDTRRIKTPIEMPNRRTGEDYALWLSILRHSGDAKGINENLVRYRRAKNSLSKNRFDSVGDLWYGQHEINGVSIPMFIFNYCCFAVNAIKKHYM